MSESGTSQKVTLFPFYLPSMDSTRSLAQHHGQPSLSASGEILGLVWIPQDRRGAEVGRLEGINQSLGRKLLRRPTPPCVRRDHKQLLLGVYACVGGGGGGGGGGGQIWIATDKYRSS